MNTTPDLLNITDPLDLIKRIFFCLFLVSACYRCCRCMPYRDDIRINYLCNPVLLRLNLSTWSLFIPYNLCKDLYPFIRISFPLVFYVLSIIAVLPSQFYYSYFSRVERGMYIYESLFYYRSFEHEI